MRALLSWLAEPLDSDHHFDSDQPSSDDLAIPGRDSQVEITLADRNSFSSREIYPQTPENAP